MPTDFPECVKQGRPISLPTYQARYYYYYHYYYYYYYYHYYCCYYY